VKPDDKMGTYVLVADRPDGPFIFTAGQGLFALPGEEGTDSPDVVDDIDGEPFIMTMVQDITLRGVTPEWRDAFLDRTGSFNSWGFG